LNDLERRNSPHGTVISPHSVAFGADYVKVVEDTQTLKSLFLFQLVSSFRKCPFGLETSMFWWYHTVRNWRTKIPVAYKTHQNLVQNLLRRREPSVPYSLLNFMIIGAMRRETPKRFLSNCNTGVPVDDKTLNRLNDTNYIRRVYEWNCAWLIGIMALRQHQPKYTERMAKMYSTKNFICGFTHAHTHTQCSFFAV